MIRLGGKEYGERGGGSGVGGGGCFGTWTVSLCS